MENTNKASTPTPATTLADGPAATGVTFHGVDGSAIVWVDPVGLVTLSAVQVRWIADHYASFGRADLQVTS